MLGGSFCLVETSQTSIMSLVESPALLDREISLANLSEDSLESGLSSLEDTGVTNIKAVALILQSLASSNSLSWIEGNNVKTQTSDWLLSLTSFMPTSLRPASNQPQNLFSLFHSDSP